MLWRLDLLVFEIILTIVSLYMLEASLLEMKSYLESKAGRFFFMFLRVSVEESIMGLKIKNKLSLSSLSWLLISVINFPNAVLISAVTGFCKMTQFLWLIFQMQCLFFPSRDFVTWRKTIHIKFLLDWIKIAKLKILIFFVTNKMDQRYALKIWGWVVPIRQNCQSDKKNYQ